MNMTIQYTDSFGRKVQMRGTQECISRHISGMIENGHRPDDLVANMEVEVTNGQGLLTAGGGVLGTPRTIEPLKLPNLFGIEPVANVNASDDQTPLPLPQLFADAVPTADSASRSSVQNNATTHGTRRVSPASGETPLALPKLY